MERKFGICLSSAVLQCSVRHGNIPPLRSYSLYVSSIVKNYGINWSSIVKKLWDQSLPKFGYHTVFCYWKIIEFWQKTGYVSTGLTQSNVDFVSKEFSLRGNSGYRMICVSGLGLDLVADHFYYDYCTRTLDWISVSRIV